MKSKQLLNTAVRVSLLDFNEKGDGRRGGVTQGNVPLGREGLSSAASRETLRNEREEADDCREELLRFLVQAPLQRSEGVCRQAHDDSL